MFMRLCLMLGMAGSALAQDVVDQSFETTGGSVSVTIDAYANPLGGRGQTFVPTVDNLVAVDLSLSSIGEARVSIHAGDLCGTELGFVTGAFVGGWNRFDFGTPIALIPGSVYSIRVSAFSVDDNPMWDWRQVNIGGPDYPNGEAWANYPVCEPVEENIWDHLFRTYYYMELPQFSRGDSNADGSIDISDAIAILSYLFLGVNKVPCEQAGDVNDDGSLDISDAVYTLGFLFLGGKPIEPPVGACGVDPTMHDLPCASFPGCQ